MKSSPNTFLLPERLCMLWAGFIAFVIAFFARLVVSGSAADAVFSGCLACLVGGWMGRLASHYVNANFRVENEISAARTAHEDEETIRP